MADFSYNIVGSGDLARYNEELRLHPGRAMEKKTRKQLNGIEFEPDPRKILLRETPLITQVYRAFGFSKEEFDLYISTALGRLATYVNNLPASLTYHHHETGGLFRHSLEVGFECIRIQDTMILTRAEYEERARATLMWGVCAFFGGILHDIGKPLVNFEVRDAETAQKWNPFTESLQHWGARIGCNNMIVSESPMLQPKLHEKYMLWGAHQIIPQEVFAYFGQVHSEDIAQALLTALSDSTKKSQLREIIEEADRNSVRDYCAKHTYSGYDTFSTRADHLLLYAVDTFLSTGEYKLNQPNQPFWMVGGDFFIDMDSLSLSQVNVLLSGKNRPKIPQQKERLVAVLGDCDFLLQTENTKADEDGKVLTSRSPYWYLKPEGCEMPFRVVRLKDNKPLRRYQTYSISGTFTPKDGFTPSEVSVSTDTFQTSGLQSFPQIEFPVEEKNDTQESESSSPDKEVVSKESQSQSGSAQPTESKETKGEADKQNHRKDAASVITGVIASAAKFSGWVVGQFIKGLHDAYPNEKNSESGSLKGEKPGSVNNKFNDKSVTETVKQEEETESPKQEGRGKNQGNAEGETATGSADTANNQECSAETRSNSGCSTETAENQECTSSTAGEQSSTETADNSGSTPASTPVGNPGENAEQANSGEAKSTENPGSQVGNAQAPAASQSPSGAPSQSSAQGEPKPGASPCEGKDLKRIKAVLPEEAVLLPECPLTVKAIEKKSILWRSFRSYTELKNSEKITVEAGTAQNEEEEALAREIMYALPIDLTEYADDEEMTRRVVTKTLRLGKEILPVLLRYKHLTTQPGAITRHPLMEYLPFWLMAAYGIENFEETFTYHPDTGILVMESFDLAYRRMRVHEKDVIAARLAFLGNTHYFSVGKEPDFGVVLADKATASMLHLLTTDKEQWSLPKLDTWVRLTNGGLGIADVAQGENHL